MNIILIIDRLKSYFQVNTNTELAEVLGVSITNISNWKSRNTIDWELIFTKCEDADFNWLIKGIGEDQSAINSPNNVTLLKEIIKERNDKIDDLNQRIGRLLTENELLRKESNTYLRAAESKTKYNDNISE